MPEKTDQKNDKTAANTEAGVKASTSATQKIRRPPTPRPFPTVPLEKSLSIANAIKDKNAGNPWAPTQVAKALGVGEKSSSLDTLYRASALYGLTSGTRGASAISIEKIGRDIVYAPSPEAVISARRRAFLNVELFSKVLEYYKGNKLPEIEFLSNTLISEFSLSVEFHSEFREVFLENCNFVQIGPTWGSSNGLEGTVERRFTVPSVPAVRTIAAEHNTDGKKCFVIMPFTERNPARSRGFFEEVFESLIKPAAEAAGFDVATANKDGSDVIQSTIINELIDSDIVIADLTDHNPNVLFELGIRMSQEKPVAIIKSTDTGRIFDVDNMLRVFEYNQNLWQSSLKIDIPRLEGKIRATWEERGHQRSYISILRTKN